MTPLLLEYFIGSTTGNSFLLQVLLNAIALFLAANLLRGVHVSSFVSSLIVALVLALLNATLGAVLDFVSTPLRWLTLGLFAFIVDAAVILLTSRLLKNFYVDGFGSAVLLAIVMSLFNLVLSMFV